MKTSMIPSKTPLALLLAGLFLSTGSFAQQALDTNQLTPPEMHRAECTDVVWNLDLVKQFPRIVDGCREVVIVNGEKWARFEADFVRSNSDGSFTSRFQDTHDRSLGNLTLMPTRDQRVTLDGRKYRFSELRPRQTLNLYIPEGVYGFAAEPTEPSQPYVQVMRYEETPEAAVSTETQREPVQLAQLEPRQATPRDRLPDTAGPLPLIALGAALSLLGGAGLTLRRRSRRHTS